MPETEIARRELLQAAPAVVAAVTLPLPEPMPDVLDGLARDLMRITPGLGYAKAREMVELVV